MSTSRTLLAVMILTYKRTKIEVREELLVVPYAVLVELMVIFYYWHTDCSIALLCYLLTKDAKEKSTITNDGASFNVTANADFLRLYKSNLSHEDKTGSRLIALHNRRCC